MEVEPPMAAGRPGPREGARGRGARGRGEGVLRGPHHRGTVKQLCTVVVKVHLLCSEPYLKCKSPGPVQQLLTPEAGREAWECACSGRRPGPHPEKRGTDGECHMCEARTQAWQGRGA